MEIFLSKQFLIDTVRLWLILGLFYYGMISLTYITLLILSYFVILKSKINKTFRQSKEYIRSSKGVSIIVPAYNEEKSILDSINNTLNVDYDNFEVIVINDGSTDDTLELLQNEFQLYPITFKVDYEDILLRQIKIKNIYKSRIYPQITVVDKINGGKPTALNTGIYLSKYDIFCAVDADTIIMKDALLKAITPFEENERTIAVGGILRVGNGLLESNGELKKENMDFNLLPLLQTIEYERDFKLGRLGWFALKSTILVSGAFGVFNKNAVKSVGGYSYATVGEDLELLMRMHRVFALNKDKYAVTFIPEETCYTEAPSSYRVLYNQRNRWHRGLMDSFSLNKEMILNSEYGLIGMFAIPYYFLAELYGPMLRLINYVVIILAIYLGIVGLKILVPILIISFLFRIIINFSTLLLDNYYFNEKPKIVNFLYLSIASLIDGTGYKQFASFSNFIGFLSFFKGNKKWGKMERTGISKKK